MIVPFSSQGCYLDEWVRHVYPSGGLGFLNNCKNGSALFNLTANFEQPLIPLIFIPLYSEISGCNSN